MEENETFRRNFEGIKKRVVNVAKLVDNQKKFEQISQKAKEDKQECEAKLLEEKKNHEELKEKIDEEMRNNKEFKEKFEKEKKNLKELKEKFEKENEEHVMVKKELEKNVDENEELKKELEKKVEENEEVKKELERGHRTILKQESAYAEDNKAKNAEIESLKIKIESFSDLVKSNKEWESKTWQVMSELEKYKQEKAGRDEEVNLNKNVMTNLKKQNSKNFKELKANEKKIKEYQTVENDKDEVIKKGLERDKKLHKALDEIKKQSLDIRKLDIENNKLKHKIEELENNGERVRVVDLEDSDDDLDIVDSDSKKENLQQIKFELPAIKKKKGSIFSLFSSIKPAKPIKTVKVRRKTPFLLLKKIRLSAGNLPEKFQEQSQNLSQRVAGVHLFLDPFKPVFDQLGNRYHMPIYDAEANIIAMYKSDPLAFSNMPMTPKSTGGQKRKINIESNPETPIQSKRSKLVPTSAKANTEPVDLPTEISTIKTPGKFVRHSNVPKTPRDTSTSMDSAALASSTPRDQPIQPKKVAKKRATPQKGLPPPKTSKTEEVSISTKVLTPKSTNNTEEATISTNILSPNMSKARARVVSSFNPTPLAISPIKKSTTLTAAQIEAVRQRRVGRAPPGVASRPSVQGFRPSEPQAPPGVAGRPSVQAFRPSEPQAPPGAASRPSVQAFGPSEPQAPPGAASRPSVQEFRPSEPQAPPGVASRPSEPQAPPGEASRPSVQGFRPSEPQVKPNKTKSSGNLGVKGVKPRNKASSNEELDSCPTRKSTRPCKMNSVSKPRQELNSTPGKNLIVAVVASPEDPDTLTGSGRQMRFPPDHPLPRQQIKPIGGNTEERFKAVIEDASLAGVELQTESTSIAESVIPTPDMEQDSDIVKPITSMPSKDMLRHDSMESLDDDLNISDSCEDEADEENLREDEVSLKTELQEEADSDNDESDKPVNRRKRKLSQNELLDEISEKSRVLNVVMEDLEEKPDKDIKRRPFAAKAPKHLLEELLFNYKVRHEKKVKQLEVKRETISKEKGSFARETFLQCLRSYFSCYKGSFKGNQSHANFVKIIEGKSTGSTDSDEEVICDLVFEEIKSQPSNEPTLDQLSEGQPPLTRLEKRLFVLLDSLRKTARFSGVMERMSDLLFNGLFARDHMYSLRLNIVCSLGRMLVLCLRRLNNVDRVKGFILDLLFFKSSRNHLLIDICTTFFPNIFSQFEDPVEKTIGWLIFNTGVMAPELMVNEVRANFKQTYGYQVNTGVRAEDLVKEFISMAQKKASQVLRLDQLRQCLIEIGRAHPYAWVNNNIVKRLYKVLQSVSNNEFGVEESEFLKIWVMKCLGSLSRLFAVDTSNNDRTLMTDSFNGIKMMLSKEAQLNMTSQLENATICSLIDHSHHLQYQIAVFLSQWKPKYPLFPETREKMEDFVGTRGRKHADITCTRLSRNKQMETKRKIKQQIKDRKAAERKNKSTVEKPPTS